MSSKKHFITFIFCVLSYCSVHAQGLYRQTNPQQSCSSILQEALKIDLSKTSDIRFSIPNGRLSQRANNGWYPVKGEIYMSDETEVAGYIYYTIGQSGLLDKRIIVGNTSNLYDSTVSVMNRTPYTQGKDLIDTVYNYMKKNDGSYTLDLRRIYSYHYFDHFEGDSLYCEIILHKWDDANKQWINFLRQKTGFYDTLVEFNDRISQYSYGAGNTWIVNHYFYDSITYDHYGFVDSLYMIRNSGNGDMLPAFKIGFTNDEDGHYTQANFFRRENNQWIKGTVYSNIAWTEWNGFSYYSYTWIGEELFSPYNKRSKIQSYYIEKEYENCFYQKWWDINGTKSNSDTLYRIIDGKLYPSEGIAHIYNEYGDYIKFCQFAYSNPDANGEQKLIFYSSWYHKYTYDEIYGMTEEKTYQIHLNDDGIIDTTFVDGIKYTEFAPYDVSITEQQEANQIAIYPNPGNNMITIGIASDDFTFRLYDLTGKLILEQKNEKNISTEFLPSGIYLYRVFSENRATALGKWVKY